MEPPVELHELTERIRAAVHAQRQEDRAPGGTGHPAQPTIAGSLTPLAVPEAMADAERERIALDLVLAEIAALLPKAGRKTEVRASVPKLLRPLYRNQGGFNGVALEVMDRLLEANRLLHGRNVRLQARLDALETALAHPPGRAAAADGAPA